MIKDIVDKMLLISGHAIVTDNKTKKKLNVLHYQNKNKRKDMLVIESWARLYTIKWTQELTNIIREYGSLFGEIMNNRDIRRYKEGYSGDDQTIYKIYVDCTAKHKATTWHKGTTKRTIDPEKWRISQDLRQIIIFGDLRVDAFDDAGNKKASSTKYKKQERKVSVKVLNDKLNQRYKEYDPLKDRLY